ncbi:hypothetical protein ACXM0N_18295 [Peribacillus simplex]
MVRAELLWKQWHISLYQSNAGVQTGRNLNLIVKNKYYKLIELYESTIQSLEQQQALN